MAFIYFDNRERIRIKETVNEVETKINKADLHDKIKVRELVRTTEGKFEENEIIIYHTKITMIKPF